MQRPKRRSRLLVLLSLAISLWMFSTGCATEVFTARRCPQPNEVETRDYIRIVATGYDVSTGRHRPAVEWMARVVAYCWPEEAEEVRNAP
jgi:hypothetical protein